MLRLCVVRLYRRASVPAIETPKNVFLDTESMGMPVRETKYSLYPTLSYDQLFSSVSDTDLGPNIIHRAANVLEEANINIREDKRKEFDTAIYNNSLKKLSEGKYEIFQIFQPEFFPKSKLIKSMVLKALIRIKMYNNILLDPNGVIDQCGINGFKKIHLLLQLDLNLLGKQNLHAFLKSCSLTEIVTQFAYLVSPEKLLLRVIARKDEYLMKILFHNMSSEKFEKICMQKKTLGTLKYPWAHDWVVSATVSSYTPIGCGVADRKESVSIGSVDEVYDKPSRESVSYLIQSDSDLHLVKAAISDQVVGLSFVSPSVLSISTITQSFVIDLKSVNLVLHLLRQILCDSKITKVVFSLSLFLDRMLDLQEDFVHFNNLVELKSGQTRLKELVHVHLDSLHDFPTESWEYRPLSVKLQEFSANDSFYLVKLFNILQPTKRLGFDPFE